MELYSKELEKQVHELFEGLKNKVNEIVGAAGSEKEATECIMRLVSSSVSAEADGYIVDLYSVLSEKVKKEEYFKARNI